MNKLTLALSFVALVGAAFAAPAQGTKHQAPSTPTPAPRGADWFGGLLEVQPKGKVAYCDYQSKVSAADLMAVFMATKQCPIPLAYEHRKMTGKFDLATASTAKGDANAAIIIVDDPALPMSLVAMEEKWGLVNVAKLAADNPKTLLLIQRVEKMVTRVATGVLGGLYNYDVNFSAMRPIYDLAALDKMFGHAIAPVSLSAMSATLPQLGLSPKGFVTYEQACIEGWAPAPTNQVQREIWADVKNPANRFKKDLPELKK